MRDRHPLIVCLCLATMGPVAVAAIGDAPAEVTSDEVSARKLLSSRTSELIRAELPHYDPVKPAEAEPNLDFEAAAGEMKDDTLYLPTMTVRQVMKAPLRSTDWLTSQGRMDFALKRFPGTRIGNFFGTNNPWAWARLAEDIEAERHDALKQLGRAVLVQNTPEDQENQKLVKAALMYSGRPPSK